MLPFKKTKKKKKSHFNVQSSVLFVVVLANRKFKFESKIQKDLLGVALHISEHID